MTPDVFIYALIDPRDGRVRYVGKTELPLEKRLQLHVDGARYRRKLSTADWVSGLLQVRLRPEIRLLEMVPAGTGWAERERHWIAHHRKLEPELLNRSRGGRGGGAQFMTPAVKATIAEKVRKLFQEDPIYEAKLRDAQARYWAEPTARQQQAERMKQLWASGPKLLEAVRAAARTPEHRDLMSIIGRQRWGAMSKDAKAAWAERTRLSFTPERRIEHGKLSKLIWRKVAANKLGISLAAYEALLADGVKFCTRCEMLHPLSAFGLDKSHDGGRKAYCRASRNARLQVQREARRATAAL